MVQFLPVSNVRMTRTRRGFTGIIIREGSAVVLALFLWAALWGRFVPAPTTPEAGMWHVFWVAFVALGYTAFHAFAAATQPLSSETLPLIDILVSLLPLGVVAYTAVEWLRGEIVLSDYQRIVMILGALAVVIDTIAFTWFTLRLNRLSHEYVRAD